MTRLKNAFALALSAHAGQFRKYTGEPYIEHPFAVMAILLKVGQEYSWPVREEMLAAAILHDVVEDTDVTQEEINSKFGYEIGRIVEGVTDVSKPEDGNRKKRKEIDRLHLANGDYAILTVKLADLIDNTSSIVGCDPNFAKVYMREKKLLLEILKRGHPVLLERAKRQVEKYFAQNPQLA